jgi:formylglycine-generating enzyme required for sulfatase activity
MQAELAEWERLQQATDIAGVEEFIKRFPGGKYFTQALDKYSELKKKKSERALETDKKRAGKTFKDCRECPEMVIIPRGSFLMGSPILEPSRDDDEGPQHKVTIDYDLAIGKYEITFDEWGACTNEKQRSCEWYDPSDEGWGKGRQPVINVGWDHAQSYVNWLANKTGKPYRLLSESEWEYAARAGTITPFSTGDCTTVEKANYTPPILTEIIKLAMGSESTKQKISCPEKIGSGKGRPVSVGSYAPNAFGLYDMMGNVREWVQDCREKDYANAPTDGSPRIFSWCQTRVRRGGAWDDNMENLRSAARSYMVTTVSSSISRSVGFRVALPIGGGR